MNLLFKVTTLVFLIFYSYGIEEVEIIVRVNIHGSDMTSLFVPMAVEIIGHHGDVIQIFTNCRNVVT
jgi:hypothetical protein